MIISVSAQHIAIGNSLQEYSKERATQVVKKYFTDIINIDIHFSKEGINFKCDIIVKYGSGKHNIVKSNDSCSDIYVAFDKAMSKLEKQLRKYKSKFKNHHTGKVKISEIAQEGTKYIISSQPDSETSNSKDNDNPAIIAEKPVEILKLSVKEAVMKMDLEDLPAVVFKNINNDRINIVYYRRDGNISWVDYN
ncbi:MAG: ribosome-associated translation inhibitor RaiA [Rickettsia endosymbiont of Ixodes persulcatus]|nr:ribosome-associated translation inhibitor RaiA [Rickettsia endosymbiont of Ixodes persulcatus]MCZ6908389.1 ribosome-associated translation inhibitor RaiA [Rickettsia endosymbiont of Ixodes persulcatus]MCZ6909999.1 ribosome-associated translation inhibitor RaiA [Rickettsia endosymbiont of Ixodes persulcatus]MCZ6914388.1 ribosome-associated translation inhibitor RaiA [Rickettsia endosymbiont of Ixodes persulcatus]MCZ6918991.1 ribosome-associated translation inhibitor RaiA [Rickettsia endosymbi